MGFFLGGDGRYAGCQVCECCHGPDRHRASKIKAARFKSASKIEQNWEYARKKQSKQLRADLQNQEDVQLEYRVYVALPPHDAHRNHLTEKIGALTHNVYGSVIRKIHSLVDDGVRDIGEMKRHITAFSKTNFPGIPESSNRFFPNNRCLRNHMYASLSLSQCRRTNYEERLVQAWRRLKKS